MDRLVDSLLLGKRQGGDAGTDQSGINPSDSPSTTEPGNPVGTEASTRTTRVSTATSVESGSSGVDSGAHQGNGNAGSAFSSTTTTTSMSSATSTPASLESSHSGGNNGVTTGALAGAVVGSIIGTALLTFLLAWFFFRRRTQARDRAFYNDSRSAVSLGRFSAGHLEKEVAAGGEGVGGGSGGGTGGGRISLAGVVPDPAADETVRGKVLTVFDQAGLHIDNYYPPLSALPRLSQDTVSRIDRYDSDHLPAPLVTLLGKPGMQRQVLTHALVQTLVRGIQSRGELLPSLFAATPQIDGNSSDDPLFAWRMLSAHLYQKANYAQDPAHTTARAEAAEAIATEFSTAFAPFSQTNFSQAERLKHLENLAKMTADLGVWLFSQPCRFEFDWTGSLEEPNVLPGVIKVCDEHGRRLGTPQVLVAAVTGRF